MIWYIKTFKLHLNGPKKFLNFRVSWLYSRGLKVNPGGNCLGARVHTVGADGKYVRGADKGANPERGDYKFMTYQQVYLKFYVIKSEMLWSGQGC